MTIDQSEDKPDGETEPEQTNASEPFGNTILGGGLGCSAILLAACLGFAAILWVLN
jgi:hypothetical protein